MEVYRIRDVFRNVGSRNDKSFYLLCQVGPSLCCLINLDSGNRIRNPIKVNSPVAITQEELKCMGDGSGWYFRLVEGSRIPSTKGDR